MVLKTPEQKIPASGYIDYRYIILPHRFDKDTWVQGVQILPENSKAMHHCNMAYVKVGEKPSNNNFITGQVPGGDAMVLDNNVGFMIPANSVLDSADPLRHDRPGIDRPDFGRTALCRARSSRRI